MTKAGRSPTVEQWMDTYLNTIREPLVASGKMAPRTLDDYKSKSRKWIVPLLGKHRLDRLLPEHLDAAYQQMYNAGRSSSTVLKVADRGQVAIWGASAGGFSALRALALTDVFAAGIARCPVVDPATWREAAPKFQAHHADGLIGPTSRERSALHEANLIKRPVLILHGEDDPVTPIQKSRALANALGADAQLITFPGEGHTLRSPQAMTEAVEAERRFLLSKLG